MAKKKSKTAQKCPDPIQTRSRTAAADKKSKPAKKRAASRAKKPKVNLPTAPPGNDQNAVNLRDLSKLPRLPFHLPRLPREAIFKHLTFADIMSFALSSNDCRNLAKKLTVKAETLSMIYNIHPSFTMRVNYYDKLQIDVKLNVKEFQKGRPTIKLGNATVLIDRVEDLWHYRKLNVICQHKSDLKYVSRLITRLILTICKTDELLLDLFENDNVQLDCFAGLQIAAVHWYPEEAPVELFRAIAENDFINEFWFSGEQLIGNFNGFIRNRKLYLFNGGWITQEHLLKMECEKILIKETTLSAASYRAFLRAWKSGRLENMKQCELSYNDRPEGFEWAARGLDSIEWHPPFSRFPFFIPEHSQVCLIRNANEKLASFVFYSNCFMLKVWSD